MIRRPIPPTSLDFLLEILASTSASLPPPTSFHLPPSPSHETPITTSSSTSSSILSDILKNIKMKYHLPSLYERSFEFRSNDSPPPPHNMFRVMQFNLLAEGLSSSVHAIPPFPEYQELDGNYGGFDVDGNDDKEIIFDYTNCRRWRLLEEILRYSPDVLAVEECDHFDDFFYPILQSIGYSVSFLI